MSPASVPVSACPVCHDHMPNGVLLKDHMPTHSKEEIMVALMQQQQQQLAPPRAPGAASETTDRSSHALLPGQPPPSTPLLLAPPPPASVSMASPGDGVHFLAAASQAGSTANVPGAAAVQASPFSLRGGVGHHHHPHLSLAPTPVPSAATPLILPQMMGMVQMIATPCLIPQPNGGPPLLVNMNNYVYPNLLAPTAGLLGPEAAGHPSFLAGGAGLNLLAAAAASGQTLSSTAMSSTPVASVTLPLPAANVASVAAPPTLASSVPFFMESEPAAGEPAVPARPTDDVETIPPRASGSRTVDVRPASGLPPAVISEVWHSHAPVGEQQHELHPSTSSGRSSNSHNIRISVSSHKSDPVVRLAREQSAADAASSAALEPSVTVRVSNDSGAESSSCRSATEPGPSHKSALTSPVHLQVIDPIKLRIKKRECFSPPPPPSSTAATTSSSTATTSTSASSTSSSAIVTVQDTLLSESSLTADAATEATPTRDANLLLSVYREPLAEASASSSFSCPPTFDETPSRSDVKQEVKVEASAPIESSDGAFSYTRYEAGSPYPAASINLSSVLLEPQLQHNTPTTSATHAKTTYVETITTTPDGFVATTSFSPSPVRDSHPVPSTSGACASPASKQTEKSSPSDQNADEASTVCTVNTLNDLETALKKDDIKIVVANELMGTAEFKTFISELNSIPMHETATHNTPNSTRPNSNFGAEAESPVTVAVETVVTMPSSPQPGSSRDMTGVGLEENATLSPPRSMCTNFLPDSDDDDEDDITLNDLVAMETMDDAVVGEEDDQHFFALSSSTNPLERYMNSFIMSQHQGEIGPAYSCDRCDLHFESLPEYRKHGDECAQRSPFSSKAKGKRSSKSSSKVRAKSSAKPKIEPVSADDSNEVANVPPSTPNKPLAKEEEDEEKVTLVALAEVKREIKSELFDTSSQPVLGSTGQHWKCHQCKVVFDTGAQLLEHTELMRKSAHKCSDCHIVFPDRKSVSQHRKKHHPVVPGGIKLESSSAPGSAALEIAPNENGEFVCDKCDRAFKERDLLVKHMSCHDEQRPFECLECGKKFTKSALLRDHRRRHFEPGSFECSFCHKRFYTPNKLREHERVHTGEAPLACNVCGKTFKRHSNLSEHKRIHQENRPVKPAKELFCHCGKIFKTQRDLDWHKEGEHDQKPKKCTYCGEVFVHGSSLTRHIRLKHEANFLPQNKKSSLYAKCPECDQTFYKTSIKKHIRIKHNNEKPFKCDHLHCDKSFVTKCNLDNHMWQHKGVRARPFKCKQCNKAYLRQALLDAHMRSHRGIKPFVCNECGLQFANKSNWQRHVAEHEGARNFKCQYCPKRFSRGYYLKDHEKVHTGEKPFQCNICGKTAATRSNYNSHLRTHITREPINTEV